MMPGPDKNQPTAHALPSDIVRCIADYLHDSFTLASLCLVNKQSLELILPLLYNTARLTTVHSISLFSRSNPASPTSRSTNRRRWPLPILDHISGPFHQTSSRISPSFAPTQLRSTHVPQEDQSHTSTRTTRLCSAQRRTCSARDSS